MKRTLFLLIVVMLLSLTCVSAESLCEQYLNTFKSSEGKQLIDSVPVSDERANIYTPDGRLIGHVEVTDKKITSIGCEELDDPTYTVTTIDFASLKEIKTASNKLAAASRLLRSKDVKIKGMTFSKKIKAVFMTRAVKTVGGLMGLLSSEDKEQLEIQETAHVNDEERCEPSMSEATQCAELGGNYNEDNCDCENIPADCASDDDCTGYLKCNNGKCKCTPMMSDNVHCAQELGGTYNWDTCECENPAGECTTDEDCTPMRHCEQGMCRCTPMMSDNVACYQELGGEYDWDTCICET